MAKKSLQKKLYDAAAKICDKDCLACFECGKSKSSYCLPSFPGNKAEVCPLQKYGVIHDDTREKDPFALWASDPTYEDLNLLCQFCDHRDKSDDTDDTISLESCFMTHCISCPVGIVRDCLDEREAEARCS